MSTNSDEDPRNILAGSTPAPWGFCRSTSSGGGTVLSGGIEPGQRVGRFIARLDFWPNAPSSADRHLIEHAPDYARRVVDLEDAARELLAALDAHDRAAFYDLKLLAALDDMTPDSIEALTTPRIEHIKPVLDARRNLSLLLNRKGPTTP